MKTRSENKPDVKCFHAIGQSVIFHAEIVPADSLHIFDFYSHPVINPRKLPPLHFHYRFFESYHEEFDSPNKRDLVAQMGVKIAKYKEKSIDLKNMK